MNTKQDNITGRPQPVSNGVEPIIPPSSASAVSGGRESEEKNGNVSSTILHTMKGDMAHAIKEQNESLVSIALAEEKKLAEERAKKVIAAQEAQKVAEAAHGAVPVAPRRGRLLIILGLFLSMGALAFGAYFIIPKLSSLSVPSIPLSLPSFGTPSEEMETPRIPAVPILAYSILPAQSGKRIEAGRGAGGVFNQILAERTEALERGTIKNIYLFETVTAQDGTKEERELSASRFLALAGVHIVEPLARALEDDMMVGLWGGEDPVPFIILTTSRYETALAGMLDEERDLLSVFNRIFGAQVAGGGSENPVFRDIIVEGRDARITEVAGQTIAYVFADEETIIIAGSEEALNALVRIAAN